MGGGGGGAQFYCYNVMFKMSKTHEHLVCTLRER